MPEENQINQDDTKIKTNEVNGEPNQLPNQTEAKQDTSQVAADDTPQQINWRKFKQQRDQERKEKLEADKRYAEEKAKADALKAAFEALANKPSPLNGEQQPITEDERVQKMIEKALADKDKKDKEEYAKREAADLPYKLRQMHNDFDNVVTDENIDYFRFHHPELAEPFQYMPDGLQKWSSMYKAMKKMLPTTNSKGNEAKMQKNLNKPQSMSIPGRTSTGDQAPRQTSEKDRAANWARMQRVIKSG